MPKRVSKTSARGGAAKRTTTKASVQPVVGIPGLNQFTRKALQLSIDSDVIEEILPLNNYEKNSELDFLIRGTPLQWIDLPNIALKVTFKVLKSDYSELAVGEKACVSAHFGKLFLRDVSVQLGSNAIISQKTGLYPFRALWEGFYCTPRFVTEQRNYHDFNFIDDFKNWDSFEGTIKENDFVNKGFGKRYELCADSKMCYMRTKLYTELTNQGKFLPPNIDLRFRLSFNANPRCIMSNIAQAAEIFVLDSIVMEVRKCTLNSQLHFQLLEQIKKETAIFPVSVPKLIQISKPAGLTNITEVLLNDTQLPEKLSYFNKEQRGRTNQITHDEFLGGRCPICIDLTRANLPGGSQISEAPRKGDLTLHLNLITPLAHQTTFVVILLYNGTLFLRDSTDIYCDWLMM